MLNFTDRCYTLSVNITQLIKEGTYPRGYRKCTLQYSLNPAVAYAINVLSEPDIKDRVLDPFCGSGTILIERQLLKSCVCVGVDIDPRAIECAGENIRAAGVEVELQHGDIMTKKFPEGYFTKIISNLPYGIHSGTREKNVRLYQFTADKMINWLRVDGKAVLVTNAKSLLRNTFAHNPDWELLSETPFQTGGLNISVFVFSRIR